MTRKKLKVAKKYLVMISEWFSFVDKRTNVDLKFSKKIETAEASLDLTQTEVQIAIRWYLITPEVVKGKLDIAVYKELESFISKQEKA
jgi:hypothetical protein